MIKLNNNKGGLVLITGASATGKNTVLDLLLLKLKEKNIEINRLITDTTREKREGEKEGIEYNYITEEQYYKKFEDGFYFGNEWSNSYNKKNLIKYKYYRGMGSILSYDKRFK